MAPNLYPRAASGNWTGPGAGPPRRRLPSNWQRHVRNFRWSCRSRPSPETPPAR